SLGDKADIHLHVYVDRRAVQKGRAELPLPHRLDRRGVEFRVGAGDDADLGHRAVGADHRLEDDLAANLRRAEPLRVLRLDVDNFHRLLDVAADRAAAALRRALLDDLATLVLGALAI